LLSGTQVQVNKIMISEISLDYDFTNILNTDHTLHTGSCIQHQVKELSDIHKKYGFSDTYCLQNTVIHQLWWDKTQIDFDKIGKQLGIEVVTVSTIMQPPGSVIPLHRDTFFQIKQSLDVTNRTCVRANIYLEDYKLGHFLQYINDDKYITSTNWKAGNGFMWDNSILHLSCNAGMENKYTMQISGLLNAGL